ncbi:solute carrier family 2, facilitated glucose transporter member 9-like [Eudromia elegans]
MEQPVFLLQTGSQLWEVKAEITRMVESQERRVGMEMDLYTSGNNTEKSPACALGSEEGRYSVERLQATRGITDLEEELRWQPPCIRVALPRRVQLDGGSARLPRLPPRLLALALLVSGGSSMLYGYSLAVVNAPAAPIKAFYNATWSRRRGRALPPGPLTLLYALTVAVFALGGLLGSLLVGVLASRYGRKGTLGRGALLVLLAAAAMGLSRRLGSPEMVILGRSVMGVHAGICLSVVPLYLGEVAPRSLRGLLGLVPSVFICLGVFSAQLLGLPELLGQERYWPLLLALVAVPASLQLLLLRRFPESPRYLLLERNDVRGATQALRWFLGTWDVRAEVQEMRQEQRALRGAGAVSVWRLLRERAVRWQTLSVAVVNAGMQLSGIDAVWFYTTSIFEAAGVPAPQIPYVTVGTGAVEIVAGLVGCAAIERLGRRPLLLAGFCCMGVCSGGLTACRLLQAALPAARHVAAACVLGIIAGFCLGPAGVPFLVTAELFTQSHRPAAFVVAGTLNWLSNFTVGLVFPFLQASAGPFCYLLFCGVCLLVALYVYVVIPETRDRSFVEIRRSFAPRRPLRAGTGPRGGYGALQSSGHGALQGGALAPLPS